ncbi:MAG: AAA-like domain-containing protein [Candidatus Aminicenantes bacterium]|nr:AAA-like domain-containing protein [Candidatus Aminicenantes bacterium]
MRRFFSYGPINTKLHYYAPRKELIYNTYSRLMGENPGEGGHYITVWAPRQCGKTWVMQEVVQRIKQEKEYEVGIFTLEAAKNEKEEKGVLEVFINKMKEVFGKQFPIIKEIRDVPSLFTKKYFRKPVILIIDEFDALEEDFISSFAGIFRDIFISRTNEKDKQSKDKSNLLHGLALVGVRSVLGIENMRGSPFNVQRSLHVPNLNYDEVREMFNRYEKESGQEVKPEVIAEIYDEIRGQPGLTCWLGELLTETYNKEKEKTITLENFEDAYAAAVKVLPNNNIINIISKADKEPYKQMVLELFKTDRKIEFTYDNRILNYLYLNGVIDQEKENRVEYYVRFASPFVQKRLFNYFSHELFYNMGQLYDPFESLADTITDATLNIGNLVKLYETYLRKNREWLMQDVPRRKDLRIYEAIYHFNFYSFLNEFLKNRGGRVFPEFPTGNGKVDLIIRYAGRIYGIELKSYTNEWSYKEAIKQASKYGKQLKLTEIFLVFFVENIDEKNRKKYEADCTDEKTKVIVKPLFVATGN